MCDGHADCSDGSDEHDCPETPEVHKLYKEQKSYSYYKILHSFSLAQSCSAPMDVATRMLRNAMDSLIAQISLTRPIVVSIVEEAESEPKYYL